MISHGYLVCDGPAILARAETCRCGHPGMSHDEGRCSGVNHDGLSEWACCCGSFHPRKAPTSVPVLDLPLPCRSQETKEMKTLRALWAALKSERSGRVSLPADGARIKMSMLDSKADLQDLMDDCERFR